MQTTQAMLASLPEWEREEIINLPEAAMECDYLTKSERLRGLDRMARLIIRKDRAEIRNGVSLSYGCGSFIVCRRGEENHEITDASTALSFLADDCTMLAHVA